MKIYIIFKKYLFSVNGAVVFIYVLYYFIIILIYWFDIVIQFENKIIYGIKKRLFI